MNMPTTDTLASQKLVGDKSVVYGSTTSSMRTDVAVVHGCVFDLLL